MQRHDFAYDLPSDLIAQTPLAERSASRLLVLSPEGTVDDRTIRDFPKFLRPNDLLVFNDTKVVAARLVGTKPSGGRVEIFLERVTADAENEALVQLRASKPIREGLEVTTVGGTVTIRSRQDDLWRVALPGPALEFFEKWGDVPLPPYIHRAPDENDRQRYQSIFARERGAVAAPTASLHFDEALSRRIEEMGVNRAFVTLHVGAGTFQPVRIDDLDAHVMHAERVTVSAATCSAIEETRAKGGRVIAIGTTVIRALESAALAKRGRDFVPSATTTAASASAASVADTFASTAGHRSGSSGAQAAMANSGWSGDTRLFIRPGFEFQVADALLTNFHLPESTLLMLVCAFSGMRPVLDAYEHAVREKYRFFSYGDAMFLTRSKG